MTTKGFQRLVILVGFSNKPLKYISKLEDLIDWGRQNHIEFTIEDIKKRKVFVLKNENVDDFDSVALLEFSENGMKINVNGDLFFGTENLSY